MNFEPEFVTLDDVLYIHEKQLERYGGSAGIRDQKLLESAVMTPQASFGGEYVHKDLFEMAAAYAFHIAENQPFIDGNKRTALAAALVFLDTNGIQLDDAKIIRLDGFENLRVSLVTFEDGTTFWVDTIGSAGKVALVAFQSDALLCATLGKASASWMKSPEVDSCYITRTR